MVKKILIAGYYGYGNTGDEAILSGMLHDLREIRPDLEFIVVSGDPERTKALQGTQAILKSDISSIIAAARQSDLIVLGGGGLFHDYWDVKPFNVLTPWHEGLAFEEGFPLLAHLVDKPCMLYAIGVGPLNSYIGKEHTRLSFERCMLATVRDEGSLVVLEDIGLDLSLKPAVTADPSFSMPVAQQKEVEVFLRSVELEPDDTLFGVCLRYWDFGPSPDIWEAEVAKAIDAFLDQVDGTVIFLPFQREPISNYEDDVAVHLRIQEAMNARKRTIGVPQPLSPDLTAAVLASCEVVLAMRLHAAIFSANAAVPVVSLAYDAKNSDFMRRIGLERLNLRPDEWEAGMISDCLLHAFEEKDRLNPKLLKSRDKMRDLARKNATLLVDLLDSGSGYELSQSLSILRELALDKVFRTIELEEGARLQEEQLTELGKKFQARTDELSKLAASVTAGEKQTAELEQKLAAKDKALNDLVVDLNKKDEQIFSLTNKAKTQDQLLKDLINQTKSYIEAEAELKALLAENKERLSELDDEVQAKDVRLQELTAIKSGIGWIFLTIMWRIRLFFAPMGSRRERFLLSVVRGTAFRNMGKWLRKKLIPTRMTPYGLVFDLYKRERAKSIPYQDLSAIRWPTKRGLVSVVLPAYNGADLIREAVDSLIAQSYEKWELIAINDGSTDDTGSILEEYAKKDGRIRVFHQDNQKIPRALSRGFRLAQGEYLTWYSCDNRLRSDFIERMVDCLQRNPGLDMVYANLDMIDENGKPLVDSEWYKGYQVPPGSEHVHLPVDTSELNIWPNNYVGAAFMYRDRVAALLGNYYAQFFTMEDYDYWMRVNGLMTLRHVDFSDPLYEYRFHSTSLTSQDNELGITHRRPRLMVYDDFRRDFYLSPIAWWVEGGEGNEITRVIQSLKQNAMNADHIWFLETGNDRTTLPSLWFPIIYVQAVDLVAHEKPIPEDLPRSALKVLIVSSKDPSVILGDVTGEWDLCIVTAELEEAPRLSHPWLGWASVPNIDTLFTTLDIRTRSHQLDLIEEELTRSLKPDFKISVVICTYRRGDRLITSVESIANQHFPENDFELIVVNNDPGDQDIDRRIAEIRNQWFDRSPERLSLVTCPLPGLSHARNVGIAEARGEVICFLDDDAIADPDWLQWIWHAFKKHPDAGVIGGTIILKLPDPKPSWIRDSWEGYWSGFSPGYLEFKEVEHWWEFPWGANWCARRKALLEIGGFRIRYGRKGAGFAGGEEIIAASLIKRIGYTIAVEPRAKVLHDVLPERFTRNHVIKTIVSGRRTWYRAQRDLYLPWEISVVGAFRRLYMSLKKIPTRLRERSSLIIIGELWADIHVIGWTFIDFVRRLRRPVALR